MKKNMNIWLMLTTVVLMLALAGGANAAQTCTFDSPAASSTITGASVLVNVTCNEFANAANCSVSASSALTADTIAAFNINATPGLIGNQSLNATITTVGAEDATDWVFAGTCDNSTATQAITSRTGVTIDNTVPTTPTALTPPTGTVDKSGTVTFSSTVTGTQTTACTLFFTGSNPGAASYAMTHTSNTCSVTLSSMSAADYSWYITATDGTNTSAATDNIGLIQKNGQSFGKALVVGGAKTSATGMSTTSIVIIGLLAAIAFDIGGLRTKLSGKKKR